MELTPLDFVAQSCMDLTEAMNAVQNESDRDTLITNHIKKVWSTVTAIEDFKKSKFSGFSLKKTKHQLTTVIRPIEQCKNIIFNAH